MAIRQVYRIERVDMQVAKWPPSRTKHSFDSDFLPRKIHVVPAAAPRNLDTEEQSALSWKGGITDRLQFELDREREDGNGANDGLQ